MPTECVWVERDDPQVDPLPVGACYFYDGWATSTLYKERDAAIRRPICVNLPARGGGVTWFCVDSPPTAEPDGHWDVTVDLDSLVPGQRPQITVTPSIDASGIYHGYLTDGVLTDDLG